MRNETKSSDIDLSIIVVSYNQAQLVCQCLDSIMNLSGNTKYEIIVVDNGSSDQTNEVIAESYPSVILIRNRDNLGFAAANNVGIKASKGRYLFLLNQDATVAGGTLANLVRVMDDHPCIGLLGCKVILPDEVLQPTYNPYPTPWNTLFPDREKQVLDRRLLGVGKDIAARRNIAATYAREYGYEQLHAVSNVSGVAMVVRRAMCDQVGLLDERFFMYYEDLDWCLRAEKQGWQIYYSPECTVCHGYYEQNPQSGAARARRAIATRSRLAYFRKHRPFHEFVAFYCIQRLKDAIWSVV